MKTHCSKKPQILGNPRVTGHSRIPGRRPSLARVGGSGPGLRSELSPRSRGTGRATGVFRRCGKQRRRAVAAALLCCAAQIGLLAAPPATAQEPEVEAAAQVQTASININTATAEELAAGLSGIGASKAMAIVRYREQFGDFETLEELSEVRGIGMATIEKNRALLRLR